MLVMRRSHVSRQRTLVATVLTLVAIALAAAQVALAGAAYPFAGPKTWDQGWNASGSYDGGTYPYDVYVDMNNKSCGGTSGCYARVALIDGGGTWHCSTTDINTRTWCQILSGYEFNKKPYCANNSSLVYTAVCDVADNS